MAGKGGNRQQKQAAKEVRRRQAVAAKQQMERSASSLAGRIAAAAASPVERCLRLTDIEAAGIGHVILAKRLPSGLLGCGFFLVDLLCLGVKDVFYREIAPSELDERIEGFAAAGQSMVPIDPASAKALVLGAAAFAASCGMDPAKDYRSVVKLFDGIDAAAATEHFAFGRNGKPVYMPGPNDSASKMRDVERRLVRARGQDGWDVAVSDAERATLRGFLNVMEQEVQKRQGAKVIDHEGSTAVDESATRED